MGTKWSSTSISGYNASPPSDDGAQTEANKVKYSTITTNLTDPLNSALSTTLTRLNELLDEAPKAKTGGYTTVSSDNARTVECDGTFSVALLAPATAGTGYSVRVKNAGTGVITVTGTLDSLPFMILLPKMSATFEVNSAASAYNVTASYERVVLQEKEASPYTSYTNVSLTVPSATSVPNSIPQITEGFEILTVSITPTSTNSTLEISWEGFATIGATGFGTAAIFQDSNANAIAGTCLGAAGGTTLNLSGSYKMTAGTISSTTFRLRVGPSSGAANLYTNGNAAQRLLGGVAAFRLRVREYAA